MSLTVLVFLSCKLLCFSCQLPYEYLTPLQAAIGVVQKVFFSLNISGRINSNFEESGFYMIKWKYVYRTNSNFFLP